MISRSLIGPPVKTYGEFHDHTIQSGILALGCRLNQSRISEFNQAALGQQAQQILIVIGILVIIRPCI